MYCTHLLTQFGAAVVLAVVPAGNAITKCPSGCIAGNVRTSPPNGDAGIDGMISVIAHEVRACRHLEALMRLPRLFDCVVFALNSSTPLASFWQLSDNVAEHCPRGCTVAALSLFAGQFGTVQGGTNGVGYYNVVDTNGRHYYLQQNWDPLQGACKLGV